MKDFAYLRDEGGYLEECDSCGSTAPLKVVSRFPALLGKTKKVCSICYGSLVGNETESGRPRW